MGRINRYLTFLLFLGCFVCTAGNTAAAELLTNGGFETGNFTGWNVVNSSGFWLPWQVTVAGAGGTFNPPFVTSPQEGARSAWNGITGTTPASAFTMDQQFTIPLGATASISWKDRVQMNQKDFCSTVAACGTASYSVQILNTSNVILQTLYTVSIPPLAYTDTGWRFHNAVLSAYAGQTIKVRFTDTASVVLSGPGQAEIDAVSVQSPSVITAADVSLGGRVIDHDGQGLRNIKVALSDATGVSKTVTTNSFGYYRFADLEAGGTYIVSVGNRQYFFPDSPRVIQVADNIADANFQASP